ncbi:MAG: hypothetical protein ACE5JF_12735, partial [Anaerolineales bacterium]
MKDVALATLRKPWVFPLALLMVGVVTHGLMIPELGFYWNDWEGIYFYELELPAIGFQYYAERPLSALIYFALFPITGSNPIAWQVGSLLLRWIGLLAVYYTLNSLWPQHELRHRWIVALLFVFPGYFLQPVSVAFSPHLVAFALYGFSLLFMVIAIRKGGAFWLLMSLAFILSAIQLFSMEYFVGLELIRPLLIWWAHQSKGETNKGTLAKKTVLYWSPFALLLGIFLWWRLLILPSSLDEDPNSPVLLMTILRQPIVGLTTLASVVLRDARHLLLDVWLKALWDPEPITPQRNWIELWRSKSAWLSWTVGAVAAIAYALYLRTTGRESPRIKDHSLRQQAVLGAAALLVGGLPFWLLGRQLTVGLWSDRFALPTMLGAVILVVCSVEWLLRGRGRMQWVLAILLGFSMAAQIYSTNKYRLDWEFQRRLYWELAWRIPVLKEGTALYGRGTFSGKSSYFDGTYVVNLLFDAEVDKDVRYAYFDLGHFPHRKLMSPAPMIQANRAGQFIGSTSRVVAFYFGRSGACARVLDKVYMDDPIYAHHISDLGLFSNLDQILDRQHPPTPDRAIFGSEPPHGWCYFFEKADLARQLRDWESVLELRAEASSLGLEPALGAEYIPFIEAHARSGGWSNALELSRRALEISPGLEIT